MLRSVFAKWFVAATGRQMAGVVSTQVQQQDPGATTEKATTSVESQIALAVDDDYLVNDSISYAYFKSVIVGLHLFAS